MLGTSNKLKTARKISITGAVSGSANFDGSSNININTSQSNIAVITGNISLSNGTGDVTVNYPKGFNYSNCAVISIGIAIYGNNIYDYFSETSSPLLFTARLNQNNIVIKSNALEGVGTSTTKQFKLVIMKTS